MDGEEPAPVLSLEDMFVSNGTDPVAFPVSDFSLVDNNNHDRSHDGNTTADNDHQDEFAMQMLRGSRGLQQANEDYNVRLHWRHGVCWQEEWRERWWCMECKGSCSAGNRLWLQKCNRHNSKQRFYFQPSQNGHQLRKAGTNLCLDRVQSNVYQLQPCNGGDPRQVLIGFKRNSPFELMPKGDSSRCLNQHHHPKATEIVETTACRTARIWFTNQWIVYHPSNGGAPSGGSNNDPPPPTTNPRGRRTLVRNPQCNLRRPCEACQAHCENDRECKGSLQCMRRNGSNRNAIVPGCRGPFVPGETCVGGNNCTDTRHEDRRNGGLVVSYRVCMVSYRIVSYRIVS